VYGFGEKKTPGAFVAACDKFIFTEILRPVEPAPAPVGTKIPAKVNLGEMEATIRNVIVLASREDGLAPLSSVGNLLLKNSPSFDSRNYGCERLSELMRRLPFVEVKEIQSDKSTMTHMYVKLKNSSA
jgi:hypothetical protein